MSSLAALSPRTGASRRSHQHTDPTDERLLAAIPMVHRTVREFAGRVPRFVDREELLAAGMLGLTQANKAYDDAKGVPFEVYARTRVTGAILDDLRSRDWLTRNQRGKAKVVIEAMRSMQQDNKEITNHSSNPEVEEIVRRTKLPAAEVNAVLFDLDRAQRMGHTGEVSDPAIAEMVRSYDPGPLDQVLGAEVVQNVRTAVERLPPRLRQVIEGVYFEGRQMQTIAEELGVTPSRVSQLCAEALLRLRRSLALIDQDLGFDSVRAS